jgi:hypothetical protein
MIELQKIILENSNWREILTSAPYSINIVENESYILFKYNQIESDFKYKVVQESRGIILRKSDFKIVCYPFDKFFNYGEALADKINFNIAKVQEKVDGSIMKLWFDDVWHLSTNGTIDAYKSSCPTGESFASLFLEGFSEYGDFDNFKNNLNKGYTYIFEMTHPLTRIVIRYKNPTVYHIGTRDNETGEELILDIGIKKPKDYSFNSFEDVINMVKTLPYSQEGYVVVNYGKNKTGRVKIKSPSYLAVHHLKNNGVVTYKRIIELIIKNEQSEFLSVFDEYKPYFDKAEKKYNEYLEKVYKEIVEIKDRKFENKKDYAMAVKDTHCSAFFFKVYKGEYKFNEFKKYLFDIGAEKISEILKLKDENK